MLTWRWELHSYFTCHIISASQTFAVHSFNLQLKIPMIPMQILPDLGEDGIDLISRMLVYEPSLRISAKQALHHEFFKEPGRMPVG